MQQWNCSNRRRGGGEEERILCESQLMRLDVPDGAGVFTVFLGEAGENSSSI